MLTETTLDSSSPLNVPIAPDVLIGIDHSCYDSDVEDVQVEVSVDSQSHSRQCSIFVTCGHGGVQSVTEALPRTEHGRLADALRPFSPIRPSRSRSMSSVIRGRAGFEEIPRRWQRTRSRLLERPAL